MLGVSYIVKVPQETDAILDRMYRFWNDGVNFSDFAGVNQSNFKTRPTAPTDQNPNNFAIGDVLNRRRVFTGCHLKEDLLLTYGIAMQRLLKVI